MLHDFYFKRDSPWINCSSIFSPNCRPFVFSIHFGNNFWNNEHIMIRYTGYRTEHGKKRKFLIWSLFSMKIEFRNRIRNQLQWNFSLEAFFLKIHALNKHILFVHLQLFYTNFVTQKYNYARFFPRRELDDRSKLIPGMSNTFAFLFKHR